MIILGDDVNVRAVVSSLQEKTRFNSKSKHVLPTRMLKKTKQIKHVSEKKTGISIVDSRRYNGTVICMYFFEIPSIQYFYEFK